MKILTIISNALLFSYRNGVYVPGAGVSYIKRMAMLVLSPRGVNLEVWSHLGCSGQNAIIFSREGLVGGCTRRNIKIRI